MTLREAVERLVATFAPEEVCLFGSWARGEARPDSDVDLLVVVPYEGDPKELALRGYRVLRGRDFPLDLLVYPRSLVEERLGEGSLLLREIFREGRCLYARGSGKVA